MRTIQLQIAGYEAKALPTGEFALDGGAMFGTVPKVLWEKTNPPDEFNRIPMEARALLLKGKDRNIVIDAGVGRDFKEKYGPKLGAKFEEIYAVSGDRSLEKSLNSHGVDLEDVTDVILTHLHFDHAGGATKWNGQELVPTFPKAKYYIQKENLETAQKPNLREKASYFAANFEPLLKSGCLEILNGSAELLKGISLISTYGHTQAQQIVRIKDTETQLMYCGDIIPTSTHVRLPFVMGYDLNPLQIIEEKRIILQESLQPNSYLFFEHDPYCDLALVEPKGEDFQVKERLHLAV